MTRQRSAVRLVLLDEEDRVLLARFEDPRDGRDCWILAGGGLEPGETLDQAARREAREELGLVGFEPGPRLWQHDIRYPNLAGEMIDQFETLVLARVDSFEVAAERLREVADEGITEFRWWTHDELRTTADVAYPAQLSALLAPVLRGELPRGTLPID